MKHEAQVVMLPTEYDKEDNHPIIKCIKSWVEYEDDKMVEDAVGHLAIAGSYKWSREHYIAQHLYITVSQEVEPIKKGDFTIFKGKILQLNTDDIHSSMIERCKGKIIATTDKKLNSYVPGHRSEADSSPLQNSMRFIHQSFIKEYCDKGGIDKVMVEYEKYMTEGWIPTYSNPDNSGCDIPAEMDYRPRLNSDNTINISSTKASWSREEVERLCTLAMAQGVINSMPAQSTMSDHLTLDKWIKENL